MKGGLIKAIRMFGALAIVPLMAGCGGGGLAALGLGSLFGGGGAISSLFGGGGATTLALLETTGGGIPVIHNPEPASMLLMGTGIAAMAFLKKKR